MRTIVFYDKEEQFETEQVAFTRKHAVTFFSIRACEEISLLHISHIADTVCHLIEQYELDWAFEVDTNIAPKEVHVVLMPIVL